MVRFDGVSQSIVFNSVSHSDVWLERGRKVQSEGIGGVISSHASISTLIQVAYL